MNAENSFMLQVHNGLHAEAKMISASGAPVVIGSGPEAGMALLDEGIVARHVSVERIGPDIFSVTALSSDVFVDDAPLAVHEKREVRAPAGLRVAGVTIALCSGQNVGDVSTLSAQFSEVSEKNRSTKKLNPVVLIAGGVAVVLGILLCQAALHPDAMGKEKPFVPPASQSADNVGTGSLIREATLSDAALGQKVVSAIARERLSALKVSAESGVVTVEGTLPAQDMAKFHTIEKWFDSAFGTQYVWISKVTVGSDSPPPDLPVQAVWTGKNPNIVVHAQRYKAGSEIVTGLSLLEIRSHRIVMSKGSQIINVRY